MGFDFTVALVPSGTSIDSELQYVKSALLYADNVTLISPVAYLYTQLTNNKNLDLRDMLRLLEYILPLCQNSDPGVYKELRNGLDQILPYVNNKRKYRALPMLAKLEFKNNMLGFCEEMDKHIVQIIGSSQAQELNALLASGKLRLQKFEHSLADVDGCVAEYFSMLNRSIRNSYPLFDEQSNNLMAAAVQSKIVSLSETDMRKIKHAGLSDNFIQRLPSFEIATVDEILDIRKELNPSLSRFRSKMQSYSDSLQSLPWDQDFESESSLLYYQEVAPAVVEIQELTRDNVFLKNLGGKFLADTDFMKSTGQLFISVAAAGVITSFTETASLDSKLLVTGGIMAAQKIKEAYDVFAEKKKTIQRKDLYFYYCAGEKLRKLN